METEADRRWMRRALAAAERGNPGATARAAALVVKASAPIASARRLRLDGAHAAAAALRKAGARARAATLYLTCEPCRACAAAIASAGLHRVVIACGGSPKLRARGIEVVRGVERVRAAPLLEEIEKFRRRR